VGYLVRRAVVPIRDSSLWFCYVFQSIVEFAFSTPQGRKFKQNPSTSRVEGAKLDIFEYVAARKSLHQVPQALTRSGLKLRPMNATGKCFLFCPHCCEVMCGFARSASWRAYLLSALLSFTVVILSLGSPCPARLLDASSPLRLLVGEAMQAVVPSWKSQNELISDNCK